MGRPGKLSRLTLATREAVNLRLVNGATGRQVLTWLNAQPEVQDLLKAEFAGEPITDQNLSEYRKGAYADWLKRRERLQLTKERAEFAAQLAREGFGLSEGAAAMVAGELLDALENLEADQPTERRDALVQLGHVIAKLRTGEQADKKLRQADEKLKQGADKLKLDWARFETLACERMLDDAVRRRAEEIANSPLSHQEKITALRAVAFSDVDALEASGEVQLPAA